MAAALNEQCKQYYAAYRDAYDQYKRFAITGEAFVAEVLADGGLAPHAVSARAKHPDSLLRKLRRKGYPNPAVQVTDPIGVRIITYFRDEVDRSVALLRPRITIDEANSADKRTQLDLRQFGYRSVHLVGRLADLGPDIPEEFGECPFEVQIRSILEHAWAENEHEIIYKSGIKFPQETSRGFAAVAGALELLDQEFERFRLTVNDEVSRRVESLRSDQQAWAAPFDAASLIAAMECLAPDNPGWRAEMWTLPPKSATLALEALTSVGLTTPHALRLAFAAEPFRTSLAEFAALSGEAEEGVSHLALCACLAATQPGFEREAYPDLLNDAVLVEALHGQVNGGSEH